MKYATCQSFAGQRASVGRIVLIVVRGHDGDPRLRAGVVVSINEASDLPRLTDLQAPETGPRSMMFHATSTAEEVEALPIDSWTWPPRC